MSVTLIVKRRADGLAGHELMGVGREDDAVQRERGGGGRAGERVNAAAAARKAAQSRERAVGGELKVMVTVNVSAGTFGS